MRRLAIIVSALVVWILAVIGALAVAVWLRLSLQDTRALVVVAAFVAFFGAFVPIVRRGVNRRS